MNESMNEMFGSSEGFLREYLGKIEFESNISQTEV
jgi:hypothetical protein